MYALWLAFNGQKKFGWCSVRRGRNWCKCFIFFDSFKYFHLILECLQYFDISIILWYVHKQSCTLDEKSAAAGGFV